MYDKKGGQNRGYTDAATAILDHRLTGPMVRTRGSPIRILTSQPPYFVPNPTHPGDGPRPLERQEQADDHGSSTANGKPVYAPAIDQRTSPDTYNVTQSQSPRSTSLDSNNNPQHRPSTIPSLPGRRSEIVAALARPQTEGGAE